jgi:hypothetical protein
MNQNKFPLIWPSGFRGEDFRNRPIKNKNCQWRPCLLMDQNEMSSLYGGPPIDASNQVSVHLAKQLQKRRIVFFKSAQNQSTTNNPFFCGKGDNSNLNIDISKMQLAMN